MSSRTLEILLQEMQEERSKTFDASDGKAMEEKMNDSKNLHECDQCGREKDQRDFTSRSDACDECMEDLNICSNCDELVTDSDVYFASDQAYCEECYRETYYLCTGCENDYHKDDMYLDPDGIDWYCSDCFYNEFYLCGNCSESGPIDYAYTTDYGDTLCSECYYEIYTECEECGETIDRECAMYDDDSGCTYCESCYEQNDSRVIKDYSYKPEPNFHGNPNTYDLSEKSGTPYIGVELEFECKYGHRGETAEIIHEFDPDCREFYQKSDGSLDHGVELVTHPCTLEYHNNTFKWSEILKKLRQANAKSHDVSTCGMHLHISRKSFTKSHEIKLAMFVKTNQRRIEMFCRRRDNHYARFKESLRPFRALAPDYVDCYERYEVLNFQNRSTIEFRLPKGTLKTSAVQATIQFTHAMVMFTKNASARTMTSMNKAWTEFVLYVNENTKQYPHLMEYMQVRGVA